MLIMEIKFMGECCQDELHLLSTAGTCCAIRNQYQSCVMHASCYIIGKVVEVVHSTYYLASPAVGNIFQQKEKIVGR